MSLRRFLAKHKLAELATAETVGFDLLKLVLRRLGLVGAGIASAAVLQYATSSSSHGHQNLALSTKGAAFIARYEGLRTAPYNDPFNCTVGVGHLIHLGRCSSSDYLRWRISVAQAYVLLAHDASSAAAAVNGGLFRPVSQPQFDALVSFTFNVGSGGFLGSSVLRAINAGAPSAVPASLLHYSYASGRFLPGLYTRRRAEGHLFASGDYGAGIGHWTPPPPPKPLTPQQKLRARTGYYAWLAWYLGERPWRRYGKQNPRVRPHVPARISRAWWRRERSFVRARR